VDDPRPEHRTLTVYRHGAEGYVVVLAAGVDETVAAEPFERVPLQVGVPFGAEDDTLTTLAPGRAADRRPVLLLRARPLCYVPSP
jgi:hypothetical protein